MTDTHDLFCTSPIPHTLLAFEITPFEGYRMYTFDTEQLHVTFKLA